MRKEDSLSAEDVLLTVQRALVLLGSASHAISLERRRIAWARLNPKLKALTTESYERRETVFSPEFTSQKAQILYPMTTRLILNVVIASTKHLLHVCYYQQSILAQFNVH